MAKSTSKPRKKKPTQTPTAAIQTSDIIEKPTIGRPTKYDPKYCDMLMRHMASGLSFESFAGVLGVFRQTLYNWEKEYPAFLDAKKEGAEKNLLFWERQGHLGMWADKEGPQFNHTVWIFSMKNRHKWKDKQDVDIKHEDVGEREKIKNMSMDELKKLVKQNLSKEDNGKEDS